MPDFWKPYLCLHLKLGSPPSDASLVRSPRRLEVHWFPAPPASIQYPRHLRFLSFARLAEPLSSARPNTSRSPSPPPTARGVTPTETPTGHGLDNSKIGHCQAICQLFLAFSSHYSHHFTREANSFLLRLNTVNYGWNRRVPPFYEQYPDCSCCRTGAALQSLLLEGGQ